MCVCVCVCARARARAYVCVRACVWVWVWVCAREEFISYRPILYILNFIDIISEFRMVAEFLILGLQKYFLYVEQQCM